MDAEPFSFSVGTRLPGRPGRTGVMRTPHGEIRTPAFIVVGTKGTVKAVLPDSVAELGAQAVLANAYHLYLQPGSELVDAHGGLGAFMGWPGPTFTDSGGFQVMSQGVGFKKVLAMDVSGLDESDVRASAKERNAHVDEDGVWFKSFLDGSRHRFTPEVSLRVQHELGADVMFAFDELTTLLDPYPYQVDALARTQRWAQRCLAAHGELTASRVGRPYQALFGVVQGAQYEDLRRRACRDLARLRVEGRGFDGFGIGGALEKRAMGTIVAWCAAELPQDKPRHLLGISEPDDFFAAVEAGIDTFDCVNPSRVARNGAIYTASGRYNLLRAENRRSLAPLEEGCDCHTCRHHTRAYLHHLFKAKEMLASTLATIHNERFTVRLVDAIRDSIEQGRFDAFRASFLAGFYGG